MLPPVGQLFTRAICKKSYDIVIIMCPVDTFFVFSCPNKLYVSFTGSPHVLWSEMRDCEEKVYYCKVIV